MAGSEFDEKAATWDDDPAKVERSRVIAERIRAALPLGPDVRMLEYGCGTGLASEALREDVGPLTLADTSEGMLEVVRTKVAAGALPDARVWNLDLSRDAVPDERFDLVVSVLVLHHIPDLELTLRGLATLLDPGGHLCLADLDKEDGSFHGPDFEGHHGFDRGEVAAQLRAAGFEEPRFEDATRLLRNGRSYGLFLAVARRAGD